MNQIFTKALWLGATVFALSLSSCSDDDQAEVKPVSDEVTEKGVFSYARNNSVEIPIQSKGAWTATVGDDCDWLTLLNEKGNGPASLVAVLDDNFGGSMRTAVVSVASDGVTSEVRISQYATVEGLIADNGDEDYIQTAATHKLGVGCNLVEYYDNPKQGIVYKKNNIFNISSLEKLQDSGNTEFAGLVKAVPRSKVDFQQAKLDTIVDKRDSLKVAFSLSISYAQFKFGISGGYHGYEDLDEHVMKLAYGAEYPTLDADISYMDALAHYSEYMSEDSHEGADYRKTILSTGLASCRRNIEKAISGNNKTQLDRLLKQLISNYGTGVVVGSQLGGRITLDLDLDSLYIKETMGVDTASVTVGFKLGLFSLDAKIDVDYQKSSIEVLQHSRFSVEIAGGDLSKGNGVINKLSNPQYGDNLPELIGEWASSITNNTNPAQCNADLLRVDVVPIWEIFDDFDCQDAVFNYVKSLYPKSEFIRNYESGAFDGTTSAPSKAGRSRVASGR